MFVIFSQVLIIDLDNNYLCRSQGDESKILPKKLQKALAVALKGDAGKFRNTCFCDVNYWVLQKLSMEFAMSMCMY